MVGASKMLRFLVIEDELFVAARIDDLLDNEGLEVIGPVGTLDEAKLLASDEMLDGVILDVNIVGGRVDDVADILTQRNVPFLFVTSCERDNLALSYRETAVVHKPFKDADLIREVRLLTPNRPDKFP
jgi:DNA-binding response OmpR family regulator